MYWMALSKVTKSFRFTETKRSISPLDLKKHVFWESSWRYGLFWLPASHVRRVARQVRVLGRVYPGVLQGYTGVYRGCTPYHGPLYLATFGCFCCFLLFSAFLRVFCSSLSAVFGCFRLFSAVLGCFCSFLLFCFFCSFCFSQFSRAFGA